MEVKEKPRSPIGILGLRARLKPYAKNIDESKKLIIEKIMFK